MSALISTRLIWASDKKLRGFRGWRYRRLYHGWRRVADGWVMRRRVLTLYGRTTHHVPVKVEFKDLGLWHRPDDVPYWMTRVRRLPHYGHSTCRFSRAFVGAVGVGRYALDEALMRRMRIDPDSLISEYGEPF